MTGLSVGRLLQHRNRAAALGTLRKLALDRLILSTARLYPAALQKPSAVFTGNLPRPMAAHLSRCYAAVDRKRRIHGSPR
jgi:hypothetical protein